MARYALKIEYDGSDYVGYQIQPNGHTIQAEIERALALMAKLKPNERIITYGSGRTDSGVHALGQVLHFDYPAPIEPHNLMKALNSIMDTSVRVIDARNVSRDFNARFDAVERSYIYRIDLSRYPNPFKRLYTLHHPYSCDLKRMQTALKAIVGTHDFTSFCSTKTDKENLIRTLYQADVIYDESQNEYVFYFRANGFLYNMIRIIVGTTLQIGDGLRPVNELERLIQVKDRQEAGPTAGPEGLYLTQIIYPQDPFE